MRISGIEPSSVILSQRKKLKRLKKCRNSFHKEPCMPYTTSQLKDVKRTILMRDLNENALPTKGATSLFWRVFCSKYDHGPSVNKLW